MTQDLNNQLSPTPNMTTANLVENAAFSTDYLETGYEIFETLSGESIFDTTHFFAGNNKSNRQEWIFDDDNVTTHSKFNFNI